jgi:uncharacterized damage-inducible protein DinB
MNHTLQTIFSQLEEQRQQLLNDLRILTPEEFNQHPEGKWSINQILAHIVAAERLSLQYLKKKILGVNEVGDTGLWEEAKMVALRLSQRIPGLKFRAPRAVVEKTPTYETFTQLEEDWARLRSEIRAFIEPIPDKHIKRKIYRHVQAGRLNIQHALLFLREHIVHHQPQIKTLLKKS